MGVRITNSILYRTALANVSRQREQLAVRQEQAASGLRVNRPSDDPAAVRTTSVLNAALLANGQFERNVSQARSRVSVMESALSNVYDLMVSLRQSVLQGANDPTGDAATNLAQAERWLRRNGPDGGTQLFEGVRAALRLNRRGALDADAQEVDTVVVLCDGATAEGPGWVRPWLRANNEVAQLVFHCVQIGPSGDGTLEALAEATGGELVRR